MVYIWEPVISGSLFVIVCVYVRIRSGTALCVLPPIFVYAEYVLLPTTLCQYNISPKSVTDKHPHQQRHVYKISNPKIPLSLLWQHTTTGVFMKYQAQNHIQYIPPHQQRCAHTISPRPHPFYHIPPNPSLRVHKIFLISISPTNLRGIFDEKRLDEIF